MTTPNEPSEQQNGTTPPPPPPPNTPPPGSGQIPTPAGLPPWFVAPPTGQASSRSRLVAGLLGIFLGGLGIHRFYLGYSMVGVIQLVATIVTCGSVGSIWGFVEGILILTGNVITTDADGATLQP